MARKRQKNSRLKRNYRCQNLPLISRRIPKTNIIIFNLKIIMKLCQKANDHSRSMAEQFDEAFEDARGRSSTALSAVADAFEELAEFLKFQRSKEDELRLDWFCKACSHVSVLFGCLGIAFKFAESEYVSKVHNLKVASKTYSTLHDILDRDVSSNTVRTPGSLSRNLRRVRQGIDLIRALFERFLSSDSYTLREAASTAYAQVCAPYHTWAVRTAVSAGMYALPSRDQLLLKLNETETSAEKEMKRFITASIPVIKYIDNLYISRNISLDW